MSRETNVLSASSVSPPFPSTCDSELQQSTLRVVGGHLIPFLFVLYITSFLDRVNVGFAALEMNHDLRFGPAVYGFGAGVFFISYALFEVPSNLILARTVTRSGKRWRIRSCGSWACWGSSAFLLANMHSVCGSRRSSAASPA